MERERNAELARQKRSLEERLSVTDARADSTERNFLEYRQSQQSVSMAELQGELTAAKELVKRAEERAEKLLQSKKRSEYTSFDGNLKGALGFFPDFHKPIWSVGFRSSKIHLTTTYMRV